MTECLNDECLMGGLVHGGEIGVNGSVDRWPDPCIACFSVVSLCLGGSSTNADVTFGRLFRAREVGFDMIRRERVRFRPNQPGMESRFAASRCAAVLSKRG